jgi:hypothetical protein
VVFFFFFFCICICVVESHCEKDNVETKLYAI